MMMIGKMRKETVILIHQLMIFAKFLAEGHDDDNIFFVGEMMKILGRYRQCLKK